MGGLIGGSRGRDEMEIRTKHRALVPNAAILVLVFATAVAAQSTEIDQLRLAAEQGDASAPFSLGFMYATGQGVPQDYTQAHKWVNLAASQTTTGEAENYRSARDKLAEQMIASQVAEAQRLAREWQPKTWEQLKDK